LERRDFLRAGTLAWAGLSLACERRNAPGEAALPVVISTWTFGRAANEETVRRLEGGAAVLDAVQHGVMQIEADPDETSVGIGGYPNREGVVELDAALMDGGTLDAGSVAALRNIKHPVAVARKVMDETPHVLLVGDGARRFALQHGFEEENLLTDKARKAWENHRTDGSQPSHDTIGMVALADDGRMAGACTTSGLAWKLPGRVGDSPLIGHGMYCDDQAGGAAATGVGEEVIKVCGSYQIVEFMRQGLEPQDAVRRVLQRILRRKRSGEVPQVGFVALRADGLVGFASTRLGFRAAVSRGGRHEVLDAPSMTSLASS
jgi:L-asparaginase/N4-(beta-N-acetylglucosaminyl)-L-asparaginase